MTHEVMHIEIIKKLDEIDNTTHTPGLWSWIASSVDGPPLLIDFATQRVIAEFNDSPNMDVEAALAAAAPSLLENLKLSQTILILIQETFANDNAVTAINSLIKVNESLIAKAESRNDKH